MKEKLTKLLLDEIRTDLGTQSRANMNNEVAEDYSTSMKAGEVFPALIVFHDGNQYILADGFHRHLAAIKAGFKEVDCSVREGSVRDATLYSIQANARHGLRRTNEDKHHTVETALKDPEWRKLSVREIAKMCAVSPQMVSYMKREMNGNGKRVGTDPITPESPPADINDSETRDLKEVNGAVVQDLPSAQPSSESGDSSGGQVDHFESDSESNQQDQSGIPAHEQGQNGTSEDVVDHERRDEVDGENHDSLEESNSESKEQDQPVSPAPESVTDLSPEADSALEPTEDVDVEDRDPMEPDQDSQKDDPTQPNSEDSSATITASLDDHPSNPVEVTPLDEGGVTQSHLNTYGGHINADLPEVVTSSNAEARKTIAYALAEHLMDHWDTTDMLKVFLKSDAPIGTIGTGEPEVNGDENIDSEVHLNMLAA